MSHNMLKTLLVVFLLATTLPGVCVAQPTPKQSLKAALHLEDYKVLKYQGENGTQISESEFKALISAGRSFSISKDNDKSVATLSIGPENAAPPKKLGPGQSNAQLTVPIGAQVPKALRDKLVGASGDIGSFTGHPLLVSFFFHDCIPCIQEVPALNSFAERNSSVAVLAVTFEPKKQASAFASRYNFKWPIAANSGNLIGKLGVKAYPTLMLISANGTLLGARTGDLRSTSKAGNSTHILQEWVQALMQPKHNEKG